MPTDTGKNTKPLGNISPKFRSRARSTKILYSATIFLSKHAFEFAIEKYYILSFAPPKQRNSGVSRVGTGGTCPPPLKRFYKVKLLDLKKYCIYILCKEILYLHLPVYF